MNMDFSNIWCWLIPLLTGLICGIIGYYWGKGTGTVVDNSSDLKVLQDKNAKLQADLDACNNSLTATPSADIPSALATTAAVVSFDAKAASAALNKTIKEDDLKVIEGIGPKIEQMFHEGGIKTWKALSDTAVARCQEILDGGGNRYKVHDPASWPMQAKMCYEGKWPELAKWQDEHDHGKL